jgi:intraflagellar transport protein 46
MKTKGNPNFLIKKIENADKNPNHIQNWIDQIGNLHKEKLNGNVTYTTPMPDIEALMQVWPDGVEKCLSEINFPNEKINLPLESYSMLVCNMLDIPINKLKAKNNKAVIESLYVLFSLYSEFKNNPHFNQSENVKKDVIHSEKFN